LDTYFWFFRRFGSRFNWGRFSWSGFFLLYGALYVHFIIHFHVKKRLSDLAHFFIFVVELDDLAGIGGRNFGHQFVGDDFTQIF